MIEKSYTDEEIAAIVRKHGLPRYPKIALLREKLSRKAKEEPQFRFYCLYGQLLREDVLKCAYETVRANQGAPGVDGVSFWRIKHAAEGVERREGTEWGQGHLCGRDKLMFCFCFC